MKRLALIFLLAATTAVAQDKPKQDTTVQLTMPLNSFRVLLYSIDVNIDSKKLSKELSEFLQKSARIVPPAQPADKPKKK